MKKFILVATLLGSLFLHQQARAGWASGGGGTGVGCFDSEANAKLADKNISNNLPLSKEQRSHLASLVTLDYWDYKSSRPFIDEGGKSTEEILQDVDKKLGQFSPIMNFRLKQVAAKIKMSDWVDTQQLEATHDAHPVVKINPPCRLLQLVVRKAESFDDKKGDADHRGHMPQVIVQYDRDLYNRLSPLNQAMLRTHEELYLIARMTGHYDSDHVRDLVAFLFSKELFEMNFDGPLVRWNLQGRLIEILGDYMMYFGEEPIDGIPPEKAPVRSQLSRYYSFYSGLKNVRGQIEKCEDAHGLGDSQKTDAEKYAINKACIDLAMNPKNLAKTLSSDEEAFVFAARFALDRTGGIKTSEYLVVPFTDKENFDIEVSVLRESCLEFGNLLPMTKGAPVYPLILRASRYCDGFPGAGVGTR